MGSLILGLVLLILALIIYFIPTEIAYRRGVKSKVGIFILNIAFGWSVIGWIGALIWATVGDVDDRALLGGDGNANPGFPIKADVRDAGYKKCPFCAEVIKSEAIKCKHCGSDLPEPEIEKQIRVDEIDAAQADAFKKAIELISSGERSLLVGILNSGIDVNMIDINGKTLLDYAEESGNGEIVKILLNRKARRGNPVIEEEKPRQVEIIPAPFGAMPPDKK